MIFADAASPIALRTGEQYRRAAQLTSATAGRASVMLVCGTSGRTLARDVAVHILRSSGRKAACGLPEAAALSPSLREGDRIVADWIPTDGTRFAGDPALVAVTACRSDELEAGWTRPAYAAAAADLVARATAGIVANGADPSAIGLAATASAPIHLTGAVDPAPLAEVRGGQIVLREPDTGGRGVLPLADLRLPPSQVDHALVGAALALLAGVRVDDVTAALGTFALSAGLIEDVAVQRGIRWLAAPTATTPGLAVQALVAAGRPAMLIAGGRFGGQPLDRWAKEVKRARYVLLYGAAGGVFAEAARGQATVVRCADLDDAVATASRLAHRGDRLLFAPGCVDEDTRFGTTGQRYADLLGAAPALQGEAA